MAWLEIKNDLIIGVHSCRCTSPNTWVEYQGEVSPGYRWVNGKAFPPAPVDLTPEELLAQRNSQMQSYINSFYPVKIQLDILRHGHQPAIDTMNTFIDACEAWAVDTNQDLDQLKALSP